MARSTADPLARRIAAAIGGRRPEDELYFNRVRFVKRVILSSVSPGPPLAEQQEHQRAVLDRCLNESPTGRILGREVLTGTFQAMPKNGTPAIDADNGTNVDVTAEQEFIHTRTEILHVGFERKPFWMDGQHG